MYVYANPGFKIVSCIFTCFMRTHVCVCSVPKQDSTQILETVRYFTKYHGIHNYYGV